MNRLAPWLLIVLLGCSQSDATILIQAAPVSALAYDAFSNATPSASTLSWTHTPVGTPRGVVVYAAHGGTSDRVTGVTYGGVAMTEATGSPNIHSTGEQGVVYCYFLGSGIPTGAQTVVVTLTAGVLITIGVCYTVTADTNTVLQDVDATINSDSQENPSITLSSGGYNIFASIGFFSGQNVITGISPLTGWNETYEYDYGTQTGGSYRYSTIGSSDVSAGWTQTAEDAVGIATAIR